METDHSPELSVHIGTCTCDWYVMHGDAGSLAAAQVSGVLVTMNKGAT